MQKEEVLQGYKKQFGLSKTSLDLKQAKAKRAFLVWRKKV